MKKILTAIILTLAPWLVLTAQTGNRLDSLMNAQSREFDAFRRAIKQEYRSYADSIDRAYSSYLRQVWPQRDLAAGVSPDPTPKPRVLPRYNPKIDRMKPGQSPLRVTNPAEDIPSQIAPVELPAHLPWNEDTLPAETPGRLMSLEFYGARVDLESVAGLDGALPREIHNTTIADFWDRMCGINPAALLRGLNETRTALNLNDWGYYLLVRRLAETVNPDTNHSRLLTWYLLVKSGYRIRVAYNNNRVVLMFPAVTPIYNIRYFMTNDVKFYAPDCDMSTVYTYEKDFPGATRVFDLTLSSPPSIGQRYGERTLTFDHLGREHSVTLQYNLDAIDFYRDYPLCDLKIYFDAAINPGARESVAGQLRPVTDGMTPREAAGFLLAMVQKGFEYKTDPEQFGREKFDFPEEILHYPYADCDDRSVFLAYLVRELTGLRVIGVLYPGHVATAIHFPDDQPGDYILWQGDKYTIADPSYIDAPVGLTMSGMSNTTATVVPLMNREGKGITTAAVWEKALDGGGFCGDNRMNAVTDAEGNTYITGYYQNIASLGETRLSSPDSADNFFIAKFDRSGNVTWAKKGTDGSKGRGYNISLDSHGGLYVTGTFEDLMALGPFHIVFAKERTGLFIARLNTEGETTWLRRVDFDVPGEGTDLILLAEFTPDGRQVRSEVLPYDPSFTAFGLSFDPEGNIFYTTSYAATLGLKIDLIAMEFEASFDPVATLKDETDKLVSANCEKAIAGLFAAINVIRLDNVSLSGKIVQMALRRYNPAFVTLYPNVYDCIGKLKVMKNSAGIVSISTEGGKPVLLDKIKITDGTRLRIAGLPNGDMRVEILGGVRVGKAIVWYDLNFVKLYRASGNITFDYAADHSQITLNMKKDLLN